MILKGNVLTNQGPKPIESLTTDDVVSNLNNRPCKILKITSGEVSKVVRFKHNPDLLISADTAIDTMYGKMMPKDGDAYIHYQCEMPCFHDELTLETLPEPMNGYELVLDSGNGIFVNGYGIYCGKENADA